jgi:hypothetical protein
MVAANEWRDYAIDHLSDQAVFSVFRRTSETPLFRIVKDPSLARKQGAYSVVSATGQIFKRGQELARVLTVFDKTLRLAPSALRPDAIAAPAGSPGQAAVSRPPFSVSCMNTVSSQRSNL